MSGCETQKPGGRQWERDTLPSPARPPWSPGHGVRLSPSTSRTCFLRSTSCACFAVILGRSLLRKSSSDPKLTGSVRCRASEEFRSQSKLFLTSWNCRSMRSLKLQPISYTQNCFTPNTSFLFFSLATNLHLHILNSPCHQLRLNCLGSALSLQQLQGKITHYSPWKRGSCNEISVFLKPQM